VNTSSTVSVFILIPVHNRRSITLNCLQTLERQGDLQRFQVVVIDDGSTDGTDITIRQLYPDVTLLKGDGQLWWTGAICKGMEYACDSGADYIIWLNDDTLPSPGTLPLMVSTCMKAPRKIVAAQCYADSELTIPTYGGQKVGRFAPALIHTPPHQVLACDCMSGNLVCFPRSVVDTVGLPPRQHLPHILADIVYTHEARRAGYELEVLGDATAICQFNPQDEGWASSPIPMGKRWQTILSYRSNLYPPSFWYYCKYFYGLLAPFIFFQAYLTLVSFTIARLVVPLPVLRRVKKLKDQFLQSNSSVKVVRDRSNGVL
jgi:GT2 family glycosyltransferase